jgi:8-oxo-dGTP pyrophosphatase MutT (NUDIX family)
MENVENKETSKKVVSAGGVVLWKHDNDIFICIVKRRNKGVWILPRGRIEKNEHMEETVIREIKEETGIEATIIKKIGIISYSFYSSKDKVTYNKVVHFYLLRLDKQEDFVPNQEIEEKLWVPLNKAKEILSYEAEKNIIDKVIEFIHKNENK